MHGRSLILAVADGGHFVPVFAIGGFSDVPGSCFRSILSSCSYDKEHILLKMSKLEFENHKKQYFSWLLRSEHVKTNIFDNRMTKLTI